MQRYAFQQMASMGLLRNEMLLCQAGRQKLRLEHLQSLRLSSIQGAQQLSYLASEPLVRRTLRIPTVPNQYQAGRIHGDRRLKNIEIC